MSDVKNIGTGEEIGGKNGAATKTSVKSSAKPATETNIKAASNIETPQDTVRNAIPTNELLGRAWVNQTLLAGDYSVGAGSSAGATPEQRFNLLLSMTSKYLSDEEQEQLRLAFSFAEAAHKGQCRKSGEPFVAHPVEVAIILADLHLDANTITASLLHDVVEDTEYTREDIESNFNNEVAALVDGVTKITQIEVESLTDEQAATMRKMFIAMSKDIRVVVIKLADRLHNMRTLAALREDRRIFKARETLEIYAPIAHRLGINSIKWELEDLSFYYLEPNKYKQVERMVTESRAQREEYLQNVIDVITAEVDRLGIEYSIAGRPKHLFSIYQKMIRQGKGFSEIYDLIAVRIIVKDIKDCYSALGAVHTLWHPMPGRFKDYIAMPKNNMYQSLHTTVIGPAARPLEVQIRTEEMHRRSEYGVAAHWRYKETGGSNALNLSEDSLDEQLAWLREVVDWQDYTKSSSEFLSNLKFDLEDQEVYVFTPKGEVKTLRAGSTPVDFAYSIHTEVGNHCVGAKVNGYIVPLSYTLQMGDRVEILTQKSATPNRNWVSMVKTPSARTKIRSYFSKVSRGDDLQFGREKLLREMKKNGFGISSAQATKALEVVAHHLGYKDTDDMLVAIGAGRERELHVANRLLKELVEAGNEEQKKPDWGMSTSATGKMPRMITSAKRPKHHETHSSKGVVVRGIDDVLVRLSKCCNPVPGDAIMGFVTRGRGVSVHRADCPNAKDLAKNPERIIEVSWDTQGANAAVYKCEVHIEGRDRLNLLRDVTIAISELGVNVVSSSTTTHKDGIFEMRFLFEMADPNYLDIILEKLHSIDSVYEARRAIAGNQKSKKH